MKVAITGSSRGIGPHITVQLKAKKSNRHGAGAARGAHNSEDIRSKRIAGIHKGNPRFPFNPSLKL
jgi:hypothetical protein